MSILFRLGCRTSILAWTCALLFTGCGSDGPAGPAGDDQAAADDLALQIGAATGTGSGGLVLEMEAARGGLRHRITGSEGPVLGKSAPPVLAADTTFTLGGLTFTFRHTFFDVQGDSLPAYGPSAVRLAAAARVAGTLVGPRSTATVRRTGELEVLGIAILADTLVFEGVADDTTQSFFQSLDGARTRHFYCVTSRTVDAVRVLKDQSANPWPLSGRVVWTVAADRLRSNDRSDVEWHLDGTAVLTFDGSVTPELVVDRVFRYRVNLVTGEVQAR